MGRPARLGSSVPADATYLGANNRRDGRSPDLMTPPSHVRVVLQECRERGWEFDRAWEFAIRSLPKGTDPLTKREAAAWRPIMKWAKPRFRLCYSGKSFTVQRQDEAPLPQ